MLFSCHQLYWQRNKVRVSPKHKTLTVDVQIINKVPEIFTTDFGERLKDACKNEFERMGYNTNFKDSADLVAFVTIGMDSFTVKGSYALSQGRESFWRMYKRDQVKAILFDYKIYDRKRLLTRWTNQNDIYYFSDEARNTRRSINMIRYTIRYGK
jgi:hypothetical protein